MFGCLLCFVFPNYLNFPNPFLLLTVKKNLPGIQKLGSYKESYKTISWNFSGLIIVEHHILPEDLHSL